MGKVIPNLQLLLILLFLSALILFLDSIKLLSLPKSGLYYLTNPISFGLYSTNQNVGRQLYFIFASRQAGQQNKALQKQLGELLSENASLRTRLTETESRVLQQESLDPRTYTLLPARPIGLDRTLKIDKGTRDGLKADLPVVFKDNYIGQIISLGEKGASVRLLTDPDSKVAAFSLNKEGRAKGIILGQFGSEMLLDKILHEEQIKEGDLVYSEGTEGFLPRGLILGKVTQILERENEIFKQAKVKPLFDTRDLELVFIITE